jgi:transposase
LGRVSRLSKEQYHEIDSILQAEPGEYGYKVWSAKALSNLISQRYGVTIGDRQCLRILHKLDFARIRPQTFPSKGYEHTEEREAFKKNGRDK